MQPAVDPMAAMLAQQNAQAQMAAQAAARAQMAAQAQGQMLGPLPNDLAARNAARAIGMTPRARPFDPGVGAPRTYLGAALTGAGVGAATDNPYATAAGAGAGLLGAYLARKYKKPKKAGEKKPAAEDDYSIMREGGPVRMAKGGAAKVRLDYPRTRPAPKKNSSPYPMTGNVIPAKKGRGMGLATRGHKLGGS
jgi:hypothetical protein